MAKPLAAILKSYSDVIAGKLPASEVNKLTLGKEPGVDYDPKMPDEREFVASHSIEKYPDRAGNGPNVYNGAKVKQSVDARHGNIPNPKSKNQYKQANEEVEQIDELTGKKKKLFGKDPLSAVANRAINRMKLPPNDGSKLSPEKIASNKKNSKVSRMAFDRMEEEVEELDEGGSQYRSAAGSGKNTNPNLSKLARKLAFEKPKYFRPPGEKSKAENREILDSEIAKFMKKGGKIRKEEVEELDEAKCNMSEANKMCEAHGMKACPKEGDESASDMEPRYSGKKKEGRQLITDKKTISEVIKNWYKMHPEKSKKKMKEESSPADTTITFPSGNSREGFKL